MRTLQEKPNHKFAGVARSIARGDPPEWLVVGLGHFSNGIGVDTSDESRRFDTIIKRMEDATNTLMTWLPMWERLPYGVKCPEDVAVVLDALPRIKKDLSRLAKKGIGRRPNAQREICAAVIVEAWKLLHGRAERRSDQLYEACGGKQIGETNDIENWRRTVERALKADHSWIKRVLLTVQNAH